MNLIESNTEDQIVDESEVVKNPMRRNFIEANTTVVNLNHLWKDCIIPVFAKDNESTISHFEFISGTLDAVEEVLDIKGILTPDIRVSHEIKGRIPSAIGKPAKELLEHEKTIYYERMAFVIEVPQISETVNGNKLNLTIGGVRAYNNENLYTKKSLEKFKVFIGFQNTVCTNLCISTDGLRDDIKVGSLLELKQKTYALIHDYDRSKHLEMMERMMNFSLNQMQFAHLIGKMKLFPYLTKEEKQNLFPLSMTDTQMNVVIRDYHIDKNFAAQNGLINFWMLYNLFTEANKTTYIDSNLERNVNAFEFVNFLANSIENQQPCWFLA